MSSTRLEDTRSGLIFMEWGFFIYALITLITGTVFYLKSQKSGGQGIGFICFIGIVGLVGLFLLIWGVYKIYVGTENIISKSHDIKMKTAIILLIAVIVLGRLDSIAGLRDFFLIRSFIELINSFAFSGIAVLLIHEIAEKKNKYYLYLGSLILIGSGIILILLYKISIGSISEAKDGTLKALELISLTTIMSSLGFFFFGLGYRKIRGGGDGDSKFVTPTDYETYKKNYRNKCPECGSSEMKIADDGSVYCKECGYETDTPF